MKVAALISGGKDGLYAAYLASMHHELACLVTIVSENPDSYLFHTPAINAVAKQAELMSLPLVSVKTKGEEEAEVEDLKRALREAKAQHLVEGVVTGAVASVYQATRIQRVCNELGLEVFNPLWLFDQETLLRELIKHNFKAIVVAVAAEPLGSEWLGRLIDDKFVAEMRVFNNRYGINPAGEGGEYESMVINCPLFARPLRIKEQRVRGEGFAWRLEVKV